MSKPIVEVFQDVRTGNFQLQHFTVDPISGFTVGTGRLVRMTPPEMRDQGLIAILNSLRGFGTAAPEPCELADMPVASRRRFHRKHKSVSVIFDGPDGLRLIPYERVPHQGAIGNTSKAAVLHLPIPHNQFFDVLCRLLAEAD
jgi:hypothetical protein